MKKWKPCTFFHNISIFILKFLSLVTIIIIVSQSYCNLLRNTWAFWNLQYFELWKRSAFQSLLHMQAGKKQTIYFAIQCTAILLGVYGLEYIYKYVLEYLSTDFEYIFSSIAQLCLSIRKKNLKNINQINTNRKIRIRVEILDVDVKIGITKVISKFKSD